MPDKPRPATAVEVFYSYSHKDEKLRDTLEEHFALLRRQGVIRQWHDRRIGAGREWAGQIDEHLKTADIILLLVSSSFIASDYSYDVELKLAMERHEAKEARVIPIILRPCDWESAIFGKLQALPKNARPVTKWPNRDDAFKDIASGLRLAAQELIAEQQKKEVPPAEAGENTEAADALGGAASLIPRPPVVGFVARRDEQGRDIVNLLREELAPEKNQLIALWGPGGCGKTTLAAEAARGLRDALRGRLAWVSALGRDEFTHLTLLDEIAAQLGNPNLRTLAPDKKKTHVGALVSEQPTLVVLDNFETVAAEEQGRCLDFLAQGASCPALITTRSRINRDDVYNVPLAAMSMEEARDFLQRLVKRTRKSANFDKLNRDELIRRCEANPLVLQWVVRQIDLAKRPQDVLDELAQGQGDAAERVFDRSLNLPQVGDDGRDALIALSLFTPHASREALAEVAGFSKDMRRLGKAIEGLSTLWLVETTEGNERFFLRGLTRELAKSLLLNNPRAGEFQRRYYEYFLHHAESHVQLTLEDLDALEVEKANLLSAVEVAFAARDWPSVMKIRVALDEFLDLRGYWDEAIRSGQQASLAAQEAGDEWSVAGFSTCIAMIRVRRAEYEEAKNVYRAALESARRLQSERGIAVCLHQLGVIARRQGDLEGAWQLCSESLEIHKKLDNRRDIALTIWGLSNISFDQGNADEAKRLLEEAHDMFTELDDQVSLSGVLNQLAMIAYEEHDVEQARQLFNRSLKIKKTLGDKLGIATATRNLGILMVKEGDKASAVLMFREALRIYEELNIPDAETLRTYVAMIEGDIR